jgi:hypothetical protein
MILIGAQDVVTLIAGTIIEQNQLKVLECLVQDAIYAFT